MMAALKLAARDLVVPQIVEFVLRRPKWSNAVGRALQLTVDQHELGKNPGLGRITARYVLLVPSLSEARLAFDRFRLARNRIEEALPYAAFMHRLENGDLDSLEVGWEIGELEDEAEKKGLEGKLLEARLELDMAHSLMCLRPILWCDAG